MLLAPIIDKKFKIEHLLSSTSNLEDIKSFFVAKKTGKGLENYLKTLAEAEEYDRSNRTYLVRDKETYEIAAYSYRGFNTPTLCVASEGIKPECNTF